MAQGADKSISEAVRPSVPGKSVAGDVIVAASACILTISIAGSAVFLGYRAYEKRVQQARVDSFVNSLEHRSNAELAADAEQLRGKPKLAKYVLPRILASIRTENDERRQVASMRIAWAFLDNQKVRRTLFEMRRSSRETVAAAAVDALARITPPEEAAKWLGQCLDVSTGAVIDAVCAGLVNLGDAGRAEMTARIGQLSVDRRIWLAGFVSTRPVEDRDKWLDLLSRDSEPRVREAAAAARTATTEPSTPPKPVIPTP